MGAGPVIGERVGVHRLPAGAFELSMVERGRLTREQPGPAAVLTHLKRQKRTFSAKEPSEGLPRLTLMLMTRLGTGLLLLAGLSMSACSAPDEVGARPDSPVSGSTSVTGASSSEPLLAPSVLGRMKVQRRSYSPGDLVKVRWPEENMRGIAYGLDRWTGADWKPTFYISAVTEGYRSKGEPIWWSVADDGHGWHDIGILGSGPDIAVVPEVAESGTYRLCTANSPRVSCAIVEVA